MDNTNLFSIGEVAKSIGITRKIILNYEKKGLIKPDKKVPPSGNRYYTIDTFTKIRTIRVFQDLGLSLDEIREYFDDVYNLQPTIDRLETMRDKISLTIEKLKERTYKSNSEIKEIIIDPQTVYLRTFDSVTITDKTNILRNTAIEAIRKYGTDITRRMYFTQYSVSEPEKVSYCVAIPPESKGEYVTNIPSLKAVSLFHHGAYENIPDSRRLLTDYAKKHDIKLSGVFRSLYIEGPPQHKDKSKFITQVIAIAEN